MFVKWSVNAKCPLRIITFELALNTLFSKWDRKLGEVKDLCKAAQLVPLFRIELMLGPVCFHLCKHVSAMPGSWKSTASASEGPPRKWLRRQVFGSMVLPRSFPFLQWCTLHTYSLSSPFSLGRYKCKLWTSEKNYFVSSAFHMLKL